MTRSIREYTTVAIQVATDRRLRLSLQSKIQENRLTSPLFDVKQWTRRFEGLLQSIWEQHASNRSTAHSFSHYEPIQDSALVAESITELDAYRWMISSALEVNKPILLHIGGKAYQEDWWIINVLPGDHVAMRLNMMDLSVFPNNSVRQLQIHDYFSLQNARSQLFMPLMSSNMFTTVLIEKCMKFCVNGIEF